MRNRSRKAVDLGPNPASIRAYLRDAQPDVIDAQMDGKAAVEERRASAVRALQALWRQWKAEVVKETHEVEAARQLCDEAPAADIAVRFKGPEIEAARRVRERWIALGAPHFFDDLLRVFFDRAGRVIFESPYPPAAMRDFWEGKPMRGRRKEDNAERDRKITADVQDQVDAGETIEKAIAAVAETVGMRSDTVHKIYYAYCLEERAVRELQALLIATEE